MTHPTSWNHRWRVGMNVVLLPFLLVCLIYAVHTSTWWAVAFALVGMASATADLLSMRSDRIREGGGHRGQR